MGADSEAGEERDYASAADGAAGGDGWDDCVLGEGGRGVMVARVPGDIHGLFERRLTPKTSKRLWRFMNPVRFM